MNRGEDPLQALRYLRYMQAIKGWATVFIGALVVGLLVYGVTAYAVGTSVPVWVAIVAIVGVSALAGGVNLVMNHGEVFGI